MKLGEMKSVMSRSHLTNDSIELKRQELQIKERVLAAQEKANSDRLSKLYVTQEIRRQLLLRKLKTKKMQLWMIVLS